MFDLIFFSEYASCVGDVLTFPSLRELNGLPFFNHVISGVGLPSAGHFISAMLPGGFATKDPRGFRFDHTGA